MPGLADMAIDGGPSDEPTDANIMSYSTDTTTKSWDTTTISWSAATDLTATVLLSMDYRGYPTFDAELSDEQELLVADAFETWDMVSGLEITQVADDESVDIRVGLSMIDGMASSIGGETLAQATYWYDSSGTLSKATIEFDIADLPNADYSTDAPESGSWSFFGTALHEIGHTLGLSHTDDPTSIMYPYALDVVTLSEDDIEIIQVLYGAPEEGTSEPELLSAILNTDTTTIRDGVDTTFYLTNNPDVAAAGIDAVEHFNLYGWLEGRDPNNFFDTDGYLEANPDVAASGLNAYDHYNTWGWREDRDPSTLFDTSAYLEANPDVAAADMNPLEHYLLYGLTEGRELA